MEKGLTRKGSATAGERERGCEEEGLVIVRLERGGASGSLRRMVRSISAFELDERIAIAALCSEKCPSELTDTFS